MGEGKNPASSDGHQEGIRIITNRPEDLIFVDLHLAVGGSDRNTGSSPGNGVGVVGCIDGSRRSDEPHERCGNDGESRVAIVSRMADIEGAGWVRIRLREGDLLRR